MPYIQQTSLQGRRTIKKRNKRKIIIGWANHPSQSNSQMLQEKEFRRQHWCIDPLQDKDMSQINYTKSMTTVICIYPVVYELNTMPESHKEDTILGDTDLNRVTKKLLVTRPNQPCHLYTSYSRRRSRRVTYMRINL